jgi:hypothetical protein
VPRWPISAPGDGGTSTQEKPCLEGGALTRFTTARRERFLTLLETGRNVEEACATVKVGRATIGRWAASGRAPGARPDQLEFADRFDAIREGRADASLTIDDLVRLLEKAARQGSVQAMKLLLERVDRQAGADAGPGSAKPDPLSMLPGDPIGDELAKRRGRR